MFCPKCGNQLDDTAAFCDKCGTKMSNFQSAPLNPSGNVKLQAATKSQSKFPIWIIPLVLVVVAVLFIFVILPLLHSKPKLSVEDVKNSYLEAEWAYDIPEFQEQTIGEAFENYFFNTSWESLELESVESNDRVNIVEFKGDFYYPVYAESPYGGPESKYITTATVQFMSDSNNDEGEFNVSTIKLKVVDDRADEWLKTDYPLSGDYLYRFLYAIYENGWFQCWIYDEEWQ